MRSDDLQRGEAPARRARIAASDTPSDLPVDPSTPAQLAQLVLLCGFAIGLAFGAIAQATRFCTMGAIADLVNFGDATRLRLWVWATLVALLGTQALIVLAGVDLSASIYTGRRLPWLSHALGGLMFGFGMVLASGCPSRALTRAGGGNLKAVVVLLVVGLAAQMTLRGLFAVPRADWLDPVGLLLAGPQDLPSWLGRMLTIDTAALRVVLAGTLAVPLLWWLLRGGRDFTQPAVLLGGLGVGALVVLAWLATGQLGHLAEHPETLEPAWLGTSSRRPEALSFVAPTAHALDLLTLWTDRGTVLSFGVATALGTLLGAAGVALLKREFRWEGFRDVRDAAQHLGGAALMGIGGVTALGCSIGQGVSGLSLLSVGSAIAVAGIVGGAVAALRYQAWVVERSA